MGLKPDLMAGGFKYLGLLTVLNVTFQLVSNVTAGKIISVLGIGVPVTVLYFPIRYILGDVITEVYGYGRARYVMWLTLFASVAAGLTYQIVSIIPPAPFFGANEAYRTVFGTVPQILVGGWLAVFLGDISKDYILAKMKIWTRGKLLWSRLIGSTVVGQFVNTTVFYVIGLLGILPTNALLQSILMGWFLKSGVEIIMTPVTYAVVRRLKTDEGIDYYDYSTNFNPLIIRGDESEAVSKRVEWRKDM